MEDLSLEPKAPPTSNRKKALPHKRSLADMREGSIDTDGVSAVPMAIEGNLDGVTGTSDADSGRSDPSESFEQCCDRHVRAFLKSNSGKGKPSTQLGLEHGDRTPSGGVFVSGVPRLHGGGNCFGRGDSIGSKSDGSQQDPFEIPPDLPTDHPTPSQADQPTPGLPIQDPPATTEPSAGLPNPIQPSLIDPTSSQQVVGQPNPDPPTLSPSFPDPLDAGQSNSGQANPAPAIANPPEGTVVPIVGGTGGSPRCLTLRGGSAELELLNVAVAFAEGGPEEPSDRQPRGFEPLDLPSSSTHGQAVMEEPPEGEEESPPSRERQNFAFFRHPETLLSREVQPSTARGADPGPSSASQGDPAGPSTARGDPPGADPRIFPPQPTSPETFHQRVEFLSQQFIDPGYHQGSSSHSAASSFDSKRTTSSGGSPEAPQDNSPSLVPRGGEPVPWRELFDLLPEARMGGPRDTVMADPNRSRRAGSVLQPSTSSDQSPTSSGDAPRPRVSITLTPGCSPDRSIVLPGLPDDLALLCIARIPRRILAQVKCVSKAWAMLIRSEELYKIRGDSGLAEPWMYALCESPRWGPWRVYDPVAQKWHLLRTPLPGADRQLVHAKFSTIGLHDKMLVVGGCYFRSGDPTEGTMLEMDQHALRDLRVYDPVKDRWSWAGDMNVARRSFAIGEIEGKVYVAGGLGQNGELLSSAEVYDPSINRWTMLPSMSVARYGCAGAVLHGKLWTYAGRIQAGDETPGGWKASSSAEVFDPESATWRTVDEMWMRKDLPNPAAVLDETLYTVDCEDDCKIKCYREATNSWFVVDQLPLPAEFKHAGSRLVAFNGELYMLGGTVFYRDGDLNRGRNVNTVEVFNPGALERGENAWRSAPNMGDGRGAIWGCAVLSL